MACIQVGHHSHVRDRDSRLRNTTERTSFKVIKESIKIKDEKIESLNNKVKELEKKLKSDSKKLSDMKQSRDSFKNLSETLKSKESAHTSQINKLEGDINSKQVIIDFLKSSLGLSDADIPIDKHGNTSIPSSQKMVETKLNDDYKSSSSRSNEEIIIQENLDPTEDNTALAANSSKNKKESGDLSANSDKLKNNPTDNMKQVIDQYYWYEAVNKNGEKYYWNETTMTVTKRKPKGLLLPVQVSKPVHGHKRSDNDHIKSCRFFELGRCKFGNRCWYSHKKEFPPRSENRPQSKNPSNHSQNSRNWESKSDVRNKSNQNAIPRQNYSFDNGNNSDIVCGKPFLGQMCQQIQNMSLMLDKKTERNYRIISNTNSDPHTSTDQLHDPITTTHPITNCSKPTKCYNLPTKSKSIDTVINKTKMHCFYTNCDSLLNKRDELETRMLTSEALICGITEILPKNCLSKPTSNDFVMKDYNLYSNIDNYSLGRGVSIYVHKSLKSTESKFHFNKDYLESVWTEIKLSASDTLLCGVIYKSQRVKENDLLDDLFLSVCNDKRYTHLLIMGDFNLSPD